ncbi:hypothetical protein FLL46_15565 [Aliikangiella coralliicola]|uniref:Uncharacterized protein n=1 Tax=Aliikangiella coralliicola TaxID=2592383 RepID=A0A545UB92_9GAMM|nr:hypothetical protein FLL46_15565 [Aliikangiella coralliicola]
MIHEELHHRWWKRGKMGHHHAPGRYVLRGDEFFDQIVSRYERMRRWNE